MAAAAKSSQELWKIHDYLSSERERTDGLFDYRYSVLLSVFAELLRQGMLDMDDLAGLDNDKLEKIKSRARP